MHRTLKRVPLNFQWPLDQVWKGYMNPYPGKVRCKYCEGTGLNPASKQVNDDYYDFEHTGRRWKNNITQDEVQALVDRHRLMDFTHVWTRGEGWKRRDDGYIPTAEEVNEASHRGHVHDSINCWILVQVRCERLGVWGTCKICKGKGRKFPPRVSRHKHNAWREYEPPTGPGYQLWETVSEGSPISPVFATPEELARWVSDNRAYHPDERTPYDVLLKMFKDEDVGSVEMGSMMIMLSSGYHGSAANMPSDA